MPPQIFPYIVKKKFYLAKDIVGLDLIPHIGEIFGYRPGQFVMLALYENGKVWQQRAFSICTSPANKNYLQLAIKIYGDFTQKVDKLKKGDKVGISGPYGTFILDELKMRDIVFLAGGIGITPFISAMRYSMDKKLSNKLTLFYSNKTEQDIAFYKELKSVEKQNKNFKFVFTLTRQCPNLWKGEKCRINKDIIKKCCLPFKNKYFFICGPPGFIKSVKTDLLKLGVPKEYIKIEGW